MDKKENPDNFIVFLKFLGECNEILRTHLNSSAMKNATFLYLDIRNELINIIGKDLILNGIIS